MNEPKRIFMNDMRELWLDRHKIIAKITPIIIYMVLVISFFKYVIVPKLNVLSPLSSEFLVYIIAMIGLIDSRLFMSLISKPCYYLFKRMKWI
jgi:hypothetical protein